MAEKILISVGIIRYLVAEPLHLQVYPHEERTRTALLTRETLVKLSAFKGIVSQDGVSTEAFGV
jgi:hypothetical protein